MQWRNFYGRTMSGAMACVKRELGADALILESREIEPGSPVARMNPGARFEICAVGERNAETLPRPAETEPVAPSIPEPMKRMAETVAQPAPAPRKRKAKTLPRPAESKPAAQPAPAPRKRKAKALARPAISAVTQSIPKPRKPKTKTLSRPAESKPVAPSTPAPKKRITKTLPRPAESEPVSPSTPEPKNLLEDMGLLRSQINQLPEAPGLDLADYHNLISRGVDHRALAPHFRAWLDWRLAPTSVRRYLAAQADGPARLMEGESLREWLWFAWCAEQGFEINDECGMMNAESTHFLALLGPTGSGKTTTLAKLASKLRLSGRQNIAIATLDACRFGAIEQWRRLGKLMDVQIHEIVTQSDLTRCMESWAGLDWVGIDTPGGMDPDSPPGRLYGSILARCPNIESAVVVPMTQQEPISRRSIERGRSFGASRLLFTKLDETDQTGSIFNLTMNQQLKIDGFATGTRVPEDWEAATAQSLWRRVLAPAGGLC